MTVTYAVVADGPAGTVIDNVASVVADKVVEVASAVASITVVRSGPTVRVEKSVDRATTAVGGEVTWTVAVRNVGAAGIPAVRVVDSAPAGTTYVAGTTRVDGVPVADRSGTTPLAGGLVVGPLAPGDTALVTFATTVVVGMPGATVENAAAAGGLDATDPIVSNQVLVAVEAALPRTGPGLDLGRYGPIAAALVLAGWLLLYVARPAPPLAIVGRRRDEDDGPDGDGDGPDASGLSPGGGSRS